MAIFRAGKRLGPFDIRVGFPRDKSLDSVDKDPRLRQHANTENTIGRFRAAMAAAEGYARTTRFAIRIFPPTQLEQLLKQEQNTVVSQGQSIHPSMRDTEDKLIFIVIVLKCLVTIYKRKVFNSDQLQQLTWYRHTPLLVKLLLHFMQINTYEREYSLSNGKRWQ